MLGEVESEAWGGVFGRGSLREGQDGGGSEHGIESQELRKRDYPVPSEVSVHARATAPTAPSYSFSADARACVA